MLVLGLVATFRSVVRKSVSARSHMGSILDELIPANVRVESVNDQMFPVSLLGYLWVSYAWSDSTPSEAKLQVQNVEAHRRSLSVAELATRYRLRC